MRRSNDKPYTPYLPTRRSEIGTRLLGTHRMAACFLGRDGCLHSRQGRLCDQHSDREPTAPYRATRQSGGSFAGELVACLRAAWHFRAKHKTRTRVRIAKRAERLALTPTQFDHAIAGFAENTATGT
jgi:hypothetical protein